MSEPRPPDVLTVQWCPACERRGRVWSGNGHPAANLGGIDVGPDAQTVCFGVPVELTYVLASDPPEKDLHD